MYCMCVYSMYACMCVCLLGYVCVYVCMCKCVSLHVHVSWCECNACHVYVRTCVCLHGYVCVYVTVVCVCVYVCMYTVLEITSGWTMLSEQFWLDKSSKQKIMFLQSLILKLFEQPGLSTTERC